MTMPNQPENPEPAPVTVRDDFGDRWRTWAECEIGSGEGGNSRGDLDSDTVRGILSALIADGRAASGPTDVWRREAMRARAEAATNRARWVDAARRSDEERMRRQAYEASPMGRVFADVVAERARQDEKWGPVTKQPNVDPVLAARGADHVRIAEHHEIPTADRAKYICRIAHERGQCSFTDILVEEVCEAVEAHADPARLREELVQVAAVVVKWLEALDLPEESTNTKSVDSPRAERPSGGVK